MLDNSRSRADVLESKLKELEARLKAFEGADTPDQSKEGLSTPHETTIGTTSSRQDDLALTPESATDLVGSDVTETPVAEIGRAHV